MDVLQSFGREYVRQLRDGSLAWLDGVVSGRMKGARCEPAVCIDSGLFTAAEGSAKDALRASYRSRPA